MGHPNKNVRIFCNREICTFMDNLLGSHNTFPDPREVRGNINSVEKTLVTNVLSR